MKVSGLTIRKPDTIETILKKSPETVTISLTAEKLKKIYQNVRVMPQ